MWQISFALNYVFDLLIGPLRSLHPLWSLSLFSFCATICILLIYHYTSDQAAIRKTKDKIKAHLLEIRIFKDNFAILLSSQKKLFFYNAVYIKHSIKPLLLIIVPLALIIMQMDSWYRLRPLRPGETVIFSVRLDDSEMMKHVPNISIETEKELKIETPMLRIPQKAELSWRLRAVGRGGPYVTIRTAKHSIKKRVVVADSLLTRLSPLSTNSNFWKIFTTPGVERISGDSSVAEIEIRYPTRHIEIIGRKLHWLLIFFVLTLAFALILKRPLKVAI
jgi:uncharacterized membrane protein (DUF106 family)